MGTKLSITLAIVSAAMLSSSLARAQSAQPTVIRWQDASDRTEVLIQGQVVRGVGIEGVHIMAALEDTGHEMRALVAVANDSKQPVNVIPSAMTLEVTKPEEKTLAYIAPGKLAQAKLRTPWLAVLGAGLQGAAAGMQQQPTSTSTTTGTITGNDGSSAKVDTTTTTTSSPDAAAQEETQERIARNARQARQQREAVANQVENTALLANTLFPGKHIMGWVYFRRAKHCTNAVLRIPLGAYVFEIPFEGTSKK